MGNEQRLHSMIKIAKFDANDGKRCKPMIQYARKDYVALQLLKSFVVGTIAFFMMLGLWVLYSMDALMEQINKMDFVKAATTLGLLYGIFMVIYLLATYIIFNMKYTYGRKKVKDQCDVSAGRTVERERKQRLGLTTEAMRKMRFFTCGNGD